MRDLPDGWEATFLSNLIMPDGIFTDGDWIESKDQDPNGSIRLLQLADIGDGVFLNKSQRFINEARFEELRCTELKENDVLVARMPAPLGRACLMPQLPQRCITVVDVAVIRPGEHSVLPRWLKHFLNSPVIRETIDNLSSGTTRRRIARKKLELLSIPVPPLNEQKRIADKLDNLLARVDECHIRLAKAASILKTIRRSIVDAATSGDLTKDWVHTDQPAAWKEVKVQDLIIDKPRNGYSPRAVDYETDIRSLALTATTSGYFDPRHIKYIDEDIPESSHLWLEPGDILIQRANSLEYVGVSAIYDGPSRGYIYPDLMMKCRANDRVLTDYLYYMLSSSSVRSYFRRNATGTTGNMPKINQKIVLSTPVSMPPMEEQKEIVRRVKKLLIYVERLEKHYERACLMTHKISSSILNKAFSGQLVPQHLNDEPASDLLKRISLLKVTAESKINKTKKSRKRKSNNSSRLTMLKREDIQTAHLSEILKNSGLMSPEKLWSESQLGIDDFYEQLKEEEGKGLLREVRKKSDSASRLLEAV